MGDVFQSVLVRLESASGFSWKSPLPSRVVAEPIRRLISGVDFLTIPLAMHLFIPTPSGPLEAILTQPKTFPGEWAAVLCHPHPQFGGTMHTKTLYRSARALQAVGIATLRFNFRGVGQSSGVYDQGRGEIEDVDAAIEFLHKRYPDARLCLLGFSFGAWVRLQVGVEDDRIDQLIGVGIPLNLSPFSFMTSCTKPKWIVRGTLDEHEPPEPLQSWFNTLAQPKSLSFMEGSTHLFEGKTQELQQAILSYFRESHDLAAVHPL